jgi:predicted amidohydrolase
MAKQAARDGAEIVVLPELFQHPYLPQSPKASATRRRAESIPGPTTERLSKLARTLGVVLIGGSIIELAHTALPFNTSPVFEADGSLIGTYRKMHIPDDDGFQEHLHFASGDTGVQVFHTSRGRLAVQICFDQWHPEGARAATLMGAEILIYPSAIGDIDNMRFRDENNWQQMWQNVHLGHAAANNIFVAAVNRIGREKRVSFWGGSFVIDPSSRLLTVGGVSEQVVLVDCDLRLVEKIQNAWGILRNSHYDHNT